MSRLHVVRAVLLGSILLIAAGWAGGPAQARVLDIAVSSSGLVVHDIPLPAGAEPSMAANLSLTNLQAMAPTQGDLGRGRLRAVVYEMQQSAPPDQVAAFYRRTMSRLFALALPGRVSGNRKATPDDGVRVLPFLSQSGYLAIRSEQVSRPSRVTVAMVDGAAQPAAILSAVETLRKGTGGPAAEQPPLLNDDAWEAKFSLSGAQVQILQQRLTPNDAASPVVDVMRVLLSQARGLNLKSRRVAPVRPAPDILAQFRDEASRSHWQLLSIEAEASPEVMALYRLPENKGMVMLRAGPAQPVNMMARRAPAVVNTTEITRLEVTGAINLQELFRPLPPRVPALTAPAIGPFPPRGPFTARPR